MHAHADVDAAVGSCMLSMLTPGVKMVAAQTLPLAGWLKELHATSRVVQIVSSTAKQETECAALDKHGQRAAGPSQRSYGDSITVSTPVSSS